MHNYFLFLWAALIGVKILRAVFVSSLPFPLLPGPLCWHSPLLLLLLLLL
jgi:hypothetical protein